MIQQVNLLAPMFRKHYAMVSAPVLLVLAIPLLAALGLAAGFSAWRGAALSHEQARLEQRRDELTHRLEALAQQLQGRGRSSELAQQLAALTAERDRKALALSTLSRRELGSTHGFSPQFTGLARQRLNGLWLTHVEFTGNGSQMALRGVTLDESLIPRYLSKLGTEPVFAGVAFRQASFARDTGNELSFELRTQDAARGAP